MTSNSALARFGLKHLSASTCLAWKASLAKVVMTKIAGVSDEVGCAAYRGSASEHGVAMGLLDHSLSVEDCQAAALKEFDRMSALSADPKRDKERAIVPGIVEQGLLELRQYGVPSHVQEKIEWQHPDLPLPFIGFIDFRFADHKIIVDMKAKSQLNSVIDSDHCMQVALYCAAIGGHEGRVTYCTPKKVATYLVEDPEHHLQRLVNIAMQMENFLSHFESVEDLIRSITPNTDHYYFNSSLKQRAYEMFGV
jgi:hypothetical protein